MPKLNLLKDSNYLKGMNSVDDPKALQDGECVELVNAIPDYPLRMRKGCDGKIILESGQVTSKPFYASFNHREYIFFWIDGGLYSIRYNPDDQAQNTATPVKYFDSDTNIVIPVVSTLDRQFDFVRIDGTLYSRASADMNAQVYMFAIEHVLEFGIDHGFRGRAVPNDSFDNHPKLDNNSLRYSTDTGNKVFAGNFAFGYSLTLVRRNGTSIIEMAYAPGLIESPEIPSGRSGIIRDSAQSNTDSASIYIKPSSVIPAVNAYGFTHIRIYRTHNLTADLLKKMFTTDAEKYEFINGAARYFLIDIPLWQLQPSVSVEIEDTVSESALLGEVNQLTSYNYTFPPADGYKMLYFKDRLFLMGARGSVFFSEIPGGDGGSDIEFAQIERNKYALWFMPLHHRIDLDSEEQTESTGLDHFGDDLYMFKSNKVYMIVGGNPVLAPLRAVNEESGCSFPDTISRAVLFGQEVLFYLSNMGPVIIQVGGGARPFIEFKISELWPETGSDLFKKQRYIPIFIPDGVRWCTSAFWNNTLWVFFQFADKDNYAHFTDTKIFGFHSSGETNGAFEIRLADLADKYYINNLVVTNRNQALTIGDMSGFTLMSKVSLVNFLSNELSSDTLTYDTDSDSVRPNFRLLSREIYPGALERNISELFRLVGYCDFTDDFLNDRSFLLEIANNRYKAKLNYYSKKTVFQNNQLGKPVPGATNDDLFVRGDGKEWKPDAFLGFVAYLYQNDQPDSGVWSSVIANTETYIQLNINFDTVVYDRIRIIAKPVIRKNIEFVPKADFVGEFFQYRITKKIPLDRDFNWYGAELEAIQRPQLGTENQVSGSRNRNVWED